ncbi:MAG: methylated-DNA--[protein]-cysteine S-methyltransferase [Muribaculaceae bacterium]|nr:methylated-DNA--[protein]-cysteine S-methyltransferase [Muribaculaceae bacterium]
MEASWHTPAGDLTIIVNRGRIVYCNWDEEDCRRKYVKICRECNENYDTVSESDLMFKTNEMVMEAAKSGLQEYFEGKRREFSLPLGLIGTSFQIKVWETLASIKYGEKVSYKEIAEKCGCSGGVRAVASACGQNPIAIMIPCHRVVSSNGKLGGYTGGVEKKEYLLALETPETTESTPKT